MRRSVASFLLAVLLLFAFTAGVMAEPTVEEIVVLPETNSFTLEVPIPAGDRAISGAQIYFELSDNLKFESVVLENVPKGASVLKDDNTVGFFFIGAQTYTGNDGKYVITFRFTDDQPGEITFTEQKFVKDLGAGRVETVKNQANLKIVVHREEPAPDEPDGLLGDVNADGVVDMKDAAALQRHVLKAETISDPASLVNADVTGDEAVDMKDAAKLMQYALKAIDSLA